MNKVPKAILPVILILVLLLAGCVAGPEPPDGKGPTAPDGKSPTAPVEGTQVGNQAPDFQLQSLDGQTVSLGNLRGKPVLINFWQTRCPYCVAEMPYIQEIYEEWSDQGLEVLAINTGESSSKAEEFMQSNNLSFTVLLDADLLIALRYDVVRYNKLYIPTTFFIDKDGIIQDKVIGAFQNKTQIENRLSKIIP